MQRLTDRWRPALALLVLQMALIAPLVWAEGAGNVLVLQNVILPVSGEDVEPKKVTLRIKDGALDLVTEDPLEPDKDTRVYDAESGHVVGGFGADDVVGDEAAGVAEDVGVAFADAEGFFDGEPLVHAGEDKEAAVVRDAELAAPGPVLPIVDILVDQLMKHGGISSS